MLSSNVVTLRGIKSLGLQSNHLGTHLKLTFISQAEGSSMDAIVVPLKIYLNAHS
jgi:hypothetical protein